MHYFSMLIKMVHVQYMGIHLNFENEMLPVTLVSYQFEMTVDYIDIQI